MTKVLCTLGLVLFSASSASATWSVVALDRTSGVVAIASATCVSQDRFERFPAKGLMDIQAIVVPGKGIAAAQAGVDRSRQNQTMIFQESAERDDPSGSSFNDGTYSMYLSVTDRDIKPTENANPVKTLRMRYDAYVRSHGSSGARPAR
jgi:hypothetical protein